MYFDRQGDYAVIHAIYPSHMDATSQLDPIFYSSYTIYNYPRYKLQIIH